MNTNLAVSLKCSSENTLLNSFVFSIKVTTNALLFLAFRAYWKNSFAVPVRLLPLFGKVLDSISNSEWIKNVTSPGLLSDKQ